MEEIRKRFRQVEQKGISVKAALSEMVGTAAFVLIGCLVAMYTMVEKDASSPMLQAAVVATSFGLAIAVSIYMVAHNSGGHLNPAVTLGMVASGVTSPVQAIGHITGQVLGAIGASLLLLVIVPHHILHVTHHGANMLPDASHPIRALLGEIFVMFIVQLVIVETVANKKSAAGSCAPLAIGIAFALGILALAPVSSGSLNPARSFGPALVGLHFKHIWIFIAGPIIGALLAAPVHLFSITDLDTTMDRAEEAAEQGSADPLLPSTVGGTN